MTVWSKNRKKDHYVYGCCDRRKYVLHGFKEAGRIRLVDAVEELRILAVILLLILASVLFVTKFRNSSHPLAKKIPILAMTANAFSEDVQNAFNAGMNAHIVKPVDMKVLIKTVRNLQTGAGAAGTLN